jgi:hypothetical protein
VRWQQPWTKVQQAPWSWDLHGAELYHRTHANTFVDLLYADTQVAVKACEQLPQSLQHCALVALVRTAQLCPSNTSRKRNSQSSHLCSPDQSEVQPPVPVSIATACLQRVAGHVLFTSSRLASSVAVLLGEQPTPGDALPHSTLCLLLAAMCSRCNSPLPQDVAGALAAAARRSLQHLEDQLQQLGNEGACPPPARLQLPWLQLQAWAAQLTATSGKKRPKRSDNAGERMHFRSWISAVHYFCACTLINCYRHAVNAV